MKNEILINEKVATRLGLGLFRYALPPKDKFLSGNAICRRILGISQKQSIEKESLKKIISGNGDYKEFIKEMKASGKVRFFITSISSTKKKRIQIAISAHHVKTKTNGSFVEGFIQDISKSKDEHRKVYQEADNLQSFLDQIPDAVYFKDLKNRITRVNR